MILSAYTPKHDFNPMDCTDIVIGTARGSSFRIWDYYTRDRSTPRVDAFWGGKNDITAAMGFEKDGVTTIAFRKKLISHEPSDHSIENDLMHVIWARGQEIGKYNHFPKSGLEKDQASYKQFYQPDELKYHGHGSQRGVTSINFYESTDQTELIAPVNTGGASATSGKTSGDLKLAETRGPAAAADPCRGEWATPLGCQGDKCEYTARWSYLPRTDEMAFTITTTHTSTWTGIGFSDDHKMSQTDAILGWVDGSGRPFLMDTWIGGYTSPLLDISQDVTNATGSTVDGITTLSFSRKRITQDSKDFSFTDDKCYYLMFPIKGGSFNAVNKKIRKHEVIPGFSSQRVCFRNCAREEDWQNAAPTPSRLQYNVEVKLVQLGENFELPPQGSQDFSILANTVSSGFTKALAKLPGFHKMSVYDLTKDDENVIARMNLEVDPSTNDRGRALVPNISPEEVLNSTVTAGKIGNLILDPAYLLFEPVHVTSTLPEESKEGGGIFVSATKLYIVLGCIAALVFVALIQAGCTLYRTLRHPPSAHKEHNMVPHSAWKDYSSSNTNIAANTNYGYEPYEEKNHHSLSGANGSSSRSTMPLSVKMTPSKYAQSPPPPHHQAPPPPHYADTRSLQRRTPGNTYSLPRQVSPRHHELASHPAGGYYTHQRPSKSLQPGGDTRDRGDRSSGGGQLQPDFYFMPSQRKYSGEVVRVYVDYNNSPKK